MLPVSPAAEPRRSDSLLSRDLAVQVPSASTGFPPRADPPRNQNAGVVLLSRDLAVQVPSGLKCLTTLFGMARLDSAISIIKLRKSSRGGEEVYPLRYKHQHSNCDIGGNRPACRQAGLFEMARLDSAISIIKSRRSSRGGEEVCPRQ